MWYLLNLKSGIKKMKYDVILNARDMLHVGDKAYEEAKSKEKEVTNAVDEINEIEVEDETEPTDKMSNDLIVDEI